MTDDLLFDVAPSLSPKLLWLQRHSITTTRQGNGRWHCALGEDVGIGADEDEAIVDLCIKTLLAHYSTP